MIPAAAVEAAHEQLDAMGSYVSRKYLETALEAAAPHMLAEAWQEGWEHYRKHFSPNMPEFGVNPYRPTT
jgi:hypothetical protein